MSLREEQSAFAKDIVKLLTWAEQMGYEVTFGEALRTPEQQRIYFDSGRSKTLTNSKHLRKLAFDLHFFKDGRYLATKEELAPIGRAWESLSPQNKWGGNWGFMDLPHMERQVP
jgi:hypothetical protein